ncbi:molybdenum ABC transporter permease [Campylobacter concisus]|uniref:Molybdenum ABC transporter permease n=1 Tax=Campylobacter concisus TaxID=199 RepID=A0A1Y5MF50_9BACT|nr:molybdenum ABC transporter permease [Campylobacter concisus]
MQAIFMPQKFILALSRGLGEVGITLILGGNIIGKTDTISLAIYNAVYDGRSDQALALSLVLVVLSFILFFIINLLDKSRV